MNAYVLGAGVSKSVGYPLGDELFDEIERFVREHGNLTHRYNYPKDWDCLRCWLSNNTNPALTHAYHAKNIEYLFTILDLATKQRDDEIDGVFSGGPFSSDSPIEEYGKYRDMLLSFLEHYFAWRHDADHARSNENGWDTLRALGRRMKAGDVVITFNYDAALERVLLDQGKWSPSDGYGFEVVFQESGYDKTPALFEPSPICVLHLHGATGWYRKPREREDISLAPIFLNGLGIHHVDASLPATFDVAGELQIILHPSFLKDYADNHVFTEIWRQAAEKLRDAERTYIIGYSLPTADAAALTLFLTSLRRQTVTAVNPKKCALTRLSLFSDYPLQLTLEEWLAQQPQ